MPLEYLWSFKINAFSAIGPFSYASSHIMCIIDIYNPYTVKQVGQ